MSTQVNEKHWQIIVIMKYTQASASWCVLLCCSALVYFLSVLCSALPI